MTPQVTPQWKQEAIPSTDGNVIGPPGIDIKDMSVAIDGITVWVGPGPTVPLTAYKSTNTGATWIAIPTNIGGLAGINADLVAIAPDNSDCIAICDTTSLIIYISTNGGTTWATLGTPSESGNDAATINDLALSVVSSGKRYVAVAGVDSNSHGNVWYFELGISGTWKQTNTMDGFHVGTLTGADCVSTVLAVSFSPNFASDQILAAVTANTSDVVNLELFSVSSLRWNNAACLGTYYPAQIWDDTNPITDATRARIALAPDYLGSDGTTRLSFIAISATRETYAGIYRMTDTNPKQIKAGVDIYSVAFDGTNLIAGASRSNTVYRSADPLVTSPTFYASATTKSPGGAEKTIVAWASTKVVAATSGNERAFAISMDDGKSFNDVSLIDTVIESMEDVAVSADGSLVYLVSKDASATSVWRYSKSWQRVLTLADITSNYIVRLAPANPQVVYVAAVGATTIYYSADAGETRWQTRTSRYSVVDLAIEGDGNVAYVLIADGTVSKSTNTGFTWVSAKSTLLSSGNTIVSLGEDNVLVGSNNGYVSYTTEGGGTDTWTKIPQSVGGYSGPVQVTGNGLASGSILVAAVGGAFTRGIWIWTIGQDPSSPWTDKDPSHSVMATGIQLAARGNRLYVCSSDTTKANIYRSNSWTIPNPPAFNVIPAVYGATTLAFNTAPKALRLSTTPFVKLWAIDTIGAKLYSFDDVTITYKFQYDVALSYASEDIALPERLATMLRGRGLSVFFDKKIEAELWGKDLYQHLINVFKDSARYCVIFTSRNYANKIWTNHELKAAQARALEETDQEYILPIKLDDTKIPGLLPTVKYVDARTTSVEQITDMIIQKLQNVERD